MDANLQSIIRAVLTSLAGVLVTNGYLSDAQGQAIIGAVLAIASVAWSIYSNRQTKAANVVAAASGTPTVVPLVGNPHLGQCRPDAHRSGRRGQGERGQAVSWWIPAAIAALALIIAVAVYISKTERVD